ncbi:MAG: sugar phosphate isomerase/epimerase [Planctomycetia bacterium]|nr:sugar phosphate isomerase/epimerase [Planctomycetia bacterium]
MIRLKIAVATASLRQTLRQSVSTAASLGADALEIDARNELRPGELSQSGARQFRKMLSDLNLQVAAISFRTRHGYDTSENLDRRVSATREAMELAARLGAQVVVNHIGKIPEDQVAPAWGMLVEVLTDLGNYALRNGVRFAAELGTESGPQLAGLFAALPEGTLAASLDPGKLLANGFSIEEALKTLGPVIAHVYATDAAPDRANLRGQEMELGRGDVDYPALLGALEEYDYRGVISVARPGATDPAAEIAQAVRYLRML